MLPLATVGFFSAGLFFAVYAYTFHALTLKKIPGVLRNFAYAYFSLAAAFMLWGIACFIGTQSFLNLSLLIGNGLLLLSTFFLLSFYFADHKAKNVVRIGCVVLAALFLWWRMTYFPPEPMLVNGILIFNTQQPVAIVLSLIILLVWLPTNIKVARLVTEKIKSEGISFTYSSIYVIATLAALLFIAVKTIPMIIASFSAIVICFIILIASNVVIDKLTK